MPVPRVTIARSLRACAAELRAKADRLEADADALEAEACASDGPVTKLDCLARTGLTPRAFEDAARACKFPSTKAGRRIVAQLADVQAYLQTRRVRPPPPRLARERTDAEDLERAIAAKRRSA